MMATMTPSDVRDMRGSAPLVVMLMLSAAFAGCLDSISLNGAPTAKMSVDPDTNIRTGDTITFSAVGSSDPDGDAMTYNWNFGDGNTGEGLTASHSYAQPGENTVTLTVSDGNYEATASKLLTIVDASAREPHAEITSDKDDDCDGEDAPAGSFILVWVCEDKDESDRSITVSTTVTLDASESWAGCNPDNSNCYAEEYLVSWEWDLDLDTDSDEDGDPKNDVDATGETVDLEDMPAGSWDIKLTVTDNNGMTDSDDSTLYINYRGTWSDFVIDRRYQEPVIMTWDYPVTYEDDGQNKIRYLRTKLTYPAEDADQPFGGVDTENRLDLFIYNSTEEEVANTTGIGDDNRDAGDCQSDDRCVWLVIGGSTVRGFLDGTWTVDLQNEKTHNTNVKSFMIELQYR
tara:strand:- start:227 stop:1432 length:1206 start_codon:yes stop_codon:yes gene_type:complete